MCTAGRARLTEVDTAIVLLNTGRTIFLNTLRQSVQALGPNVISGGNHEV
jgi:hypothetical protein